MKKAKLILAGAAATAALSLTACGDKQIAEPKETDKKENCTFTEPKSGCEILPPVVPGGRKPWMDVSGITTEKQK
ncbi:MAG: hypothetical protein FWE52_01690 [Alphaproteobacteria bacterium]|nr:hypothetical protein [Alphaproteobacteria bacterium]